MIIEITLFHSTNNCHYMLFMKAERRFNNPVKIDAKRRSDSIVLYKSLLQC
jgi:hypothetical protein